MIKVLLHYRQAVVLLVSLVGAAIVAADTSGDERKVIKAIYVPLADHYAGIIAYEKYRDEMKFADYRIEQMKSWALLRAYFMSMEVDMAYIICPQAMDMFAEKPDFRWVSLMHRDGNALAINELLNAHVHLPPKRSERKPDAKIAQAFTAARIRADRPVECAVPSLHATHTVVLYKYLRDHGITLGLDVGADKDVVAIATPPPKSPAFIKRRNSRSLPAAFEESLPWADVVETREFGRVAWYSKDVIPWPNGHVECIAIATDECIETKAEALREVIYYIHKAGIDIEESRRKGGQAMVTISDMIRKHIPEHNREAIIQSLRPDLNVINYRHLNLDPAGLKQIMDLAVEGGILEQPIDIGMFADTSFATEITDVEMGNFSLEVTGDADRISDRMQIVLAQRINAIRGWATAPTVVASVKAQNAEPMTLEEIKVIDREWVAGEREAFAESLQDNEVGRFLREEISSDTAAYTEAFLCDKRGAIVGEFRKTSDYWQGDEDKFEECISGSVYQGPLLLDRSSSSFSVQISVPVMDHDSVIGVLVVGLRNLR